MGCGSSSVEPVGSINQPSKKPGPNSNPTKMATVRVAREYHGEYEVSIHSGGDGKLQIFEEGMLWRAYPAILPVLDMERNALVFKCGLETFSIIFKMDDDESKFTGWYRVSDEQAWVQVGGVRVVSGGMKRQKSSVVSLPPPPTEPVKLSKDVLKKYVDIQNEIDTLGDPSLDADMAESKLAFLEGRMASEKNEVAKLLGTADRGKTDAAIGLQNFGKSLEEERDAANLELATARRAETKLAALQAEEQALLQAVFGGKYGNEREQALEMEMESALAHADNVKQVKLEWSEAHRFLGAGAILIGQAAALTTEWLTTRVGPQGVVSVSESEVRQLHLLAVDAYFKFARTWFYLPKQRLPHFGGEHMAVLYGLRQSVLSEAYFQQKLAIAGSYFTDLANRSRRAQHWVGEVLQKRVMVDYESSQRQLVKVSDALREERRNVLAQWISVTYDLNEEDVKAEVQAAVPSGVDKSNQDLLREKEELQRKLEEMERKLKAATEEAEKEDKKAAADIKIPTSEEVGLSTTGVMIQTDAAAQRLEKELKDQRLKQNKILQERLQNRRKSRKIGRRQSVAHAATSGNLVGAVPPPQ